MKRGHRRKYRLVSEPEKVQRPEKPGDHAPIGTKFGGLFQGRDRGLWGPRVPKSLGARFSTRPGGTEATGSAKTTMVWAEPREGTLGTREKTGRIMERGKS